jgi:hypothetical protein
MLLDVMTLEDLQCPCCEQYLHKYLRYWPLEVTDNTVMRKWKWVFVNGPESKRLPSTEMEFLNLRKGGTDAPACEEIMLKIMIPDGNECRLC